MIYLLFSGRPTKSRKSGKRILKLISCIFCGKVIVGRLTRHMLNVHRQHERVRLICKLPLYSQKRKLALSLLLREAYFIHNKKVLETGEGNLAIDERSANVPAAEFFPCENCKQLVLKKNETTHKNKCKSYEIASEELKEILAETEAGSHTLDHYPEDPEGNLLEEEDPIKEEDMVEMDRLLLNPPNGMF